MQRHQDQRQRTLGYAGRQRPLGVADGDAKLGRRVQADLVDPHAVPRQQAQVVRQVAQAAVAVLLAEADNHLVALEHFFLLIRIPGRLQAQLEDVHRIALSLHKTCKLPPDRLRRARAGIRNFTHQ